MRNRVGLGTYPLSVSPNLSQGDAKNLIKQFLNMGGFYIDTAPLYGFGKAELILGEALKQISRDNFFIASKCGYINVEGKSFHTIKKGSTYDDVIRECDTSLHRLGLDYLDLYLTHVPDKKTPFDETMQALTKLQQEGKIKTIGVCNVDLDQLKQYNQEGKVTYVQNHFSLINQNLSDDFKNYLLENDIALTPYHVIEVREELSPIAKRLGISTVQLAISWALHQQYIGFVLVGITNPSYIQPDLQASTIKLSPDVLKDIDLCLNTFQNHNRPS